MNMNLRVPIMISRLNSALFAAAAQIFHPLRACEEEPFVELLSTEKSSEFGQNPNGELFIRNSSNDLSLRL